jgi:3-hydroxyacyl-[acyl-carrier-protein] dehydratase
MPPPLLFPIPASDLARTLWTREQIYARLPHRHEFQLLDGVCRAEVRGDVREILAYADVRADAWWVRGHVPGRPILPGVLMLEMAAQTSAVLLKLAQPEHEEFVGFGGIDDCKFREAVTPPARLYILCRPLEYRPRRIISATQGVLDGRLVFEATITGLMLRD